MVREMRDLIKGVVKDHRLPNDYNFHYTQPIFSKAFLKGIKRYIVVRQLTKTHVAVPLLGLFGLGIPICLTSVLMRYLFQGYFPNAFQPQNYLYRRGHYGDQHSYNMNPDNHYDNNLHCWTTDPMCGVDVGPKRPWEDLKEPEKVLFKLQRGTTEDVRKNVHGYRGF